MVVTLVLMGRALHIINTPCMSLTGWIKAG